MGDWIVEQMPNARLRPWVHDDYCETDMLRRKLAPGRDFVKVSDADSQEDAERQAEAYFIGSHQAPQR
jgi:hypothetical protein